MHWEKNPKFDVNKNFHGGRKKLVATIISNCKDNSARLEYIKELSKHTSVDIYGKCGQECPTKCLQIVGNEYKFFLSFENSVCDQYITEKFFKILQYDTIPIVLGAGDYQRFVI